jgi:hypothetical protein
LAPVALEPANEPEEGLCFDLPIVEPPAPESATFEIIGAEPREETLGVEEPSLTIALSEDGCLETDEAAILQETPSEIGEPATAASNGHGGGLWHVLGRLGALVQGFVRKLTDTASR